jgi:hypothetical protein
VALIQGIGSALAQDIYVPYTATVDARAPVLTESGALAKQEPDWSAQSQQHSHAASHRTACPASQVYPTATNDNAGKASASTEDGNEQTAEFWTVFGTRFRITDALLVLFNCLVFVATVWLVLVTLFASRRQLRAYICVQGCKLHSPANGSESTVHLVIKNYGLTPAYSVTTWARSLYHEGPSTPNFSFPEGSQPARSSSIVAPSGVQEPYVPVEPLDEAALFMIRAAEAAVYVWGGVTYRDVFRGKRHLAFRLMMKGCGIENGRFMNCDEGNEAN